MHDIISKLTFGFVMAQLVPGALLVNSVTLVSVAYGAGSVDSLAALMPTAFQFWFDAGASGAVIFLALATGAGMAIHGLNWGVLGFLENRHQLSDSGDQPPRPASTSFWHDYPIGAQIVLGPVKLVVEVALLLGTPLRGHSLRDIAIDENVGRIPQPKMAGFQFVQDFYLNFAQFYAHTSYALVAAFLSLAILMSISSFSWKAVILAALVYLIAGYFFVIGRMQFASLFKAEGSLTETPQKPTRRRKTSR